MTKNLEKKCGKEACGCSVSSQEILENTQIKPQELHKDDRKEKDPTRFGDWEVNGRAIDF